MDPYVSVIVPTHNRWPLLARALASVLAQSEREIEVLVIDDASSDKTPERLAALSDPRVRAIRQEPNQGVAAARNRGVAEASAPWVAFLDDDDYWGPDRISAHLGAVAGVDAKWSYGSAITVEPQGAPREVMRAPSPEDLAARLGQANVVGTPSTVAVRTELVRETGGFDENLSVVADWDLWIRLADRADAIAITIPHVAYCQHDDNMRRNGRWETRLELEYLARKHAARAPDSTKSFAAATFDRMRIKDDRLAGRRFRASAGYLKVGLRERSGTDVLRGCGMILGERALRRLGGATKPSAPEPSWLSAGFRATLADDA